MKERPVLQRLDRLERSISQLRQDVKKLVEATQPIQNEATNGYIVLDNKQITLKYKNQDG